MNYILSKINQRIEIAKVLQNGENMIVYYQSRIEYLLILMLGYLWNKHFEDQPLDEKESLSNDILCPSIGTIVQVTRRLDEEKEFFGDKRISKALNAYPAIRNTQLGHGFTFSDSKCNLEEDINNIYTTLISSSHTLFNGDFDFIWVNNIKEGKAFGIKYGCSPDGIVPWTCPLAIFAFQTDCLYIYTSDNHYYNVSPFIRINDGGDKCFIFNRISDKLLGKIHYNRLNYTGTEDVVWSPFISLSLSNDGYRERFSNGTIRNVYDKNFKTYIDVGIKKDIIAFLDNRANVCATLWGHGGIGKTATIQDICDHYVSVDNKKFDYIIFLSAKDRKYDYYKGTIENISSSISTFEDVIIALNKLVYNSNSDCSQENIINFDGKMLIVIDDFESFAKEEANKISDFLMRLDVNHHKVVVTTRAASVSIGQEIKTSELNIENTIAFLKSTLTNESIVISNQDMQKLEKEEVRTKIFNITSGRPLFILQLAFIIGQQGIDKAIGINIKTSKSAVDFLYGRMYDYLSPKAKDVFVAMGLIVSKDNMTNVLTKIKYILNMENDDDGFNSSVDELKKLKLIKTTDDENAYYEVYSKEILEIMNRQFAQRDSSFIGSCNSRCNQINKDKEADIEHSLLNNANANRLAKSEIETIESYKQILNRPTSPLEVRLSAIMNLTSYLILDCGKRTDALDVFEKYSTHFTSITIQSSNRDLYAIFALRWAITNWGNGSPSERAKAITILSDYRNSGVRAHNEYDIEIQSVLLMYRSLNILTQWRELKDKMYYNEIQYSDYEIARRNQINECKSIDSHIGQPLYRLVVKHKLNEFKTSTRQSIITAFNSYVDILVRLRKIDLAIEICNYIINCGPQNFILQFESKRNWIKSIRSKK